MCPRLATAAFVCALLAGNATASEPTAGSTLIVQQRTANGVILLTDRPIADAVIERSWIARGVAAASATERNDGVERAPFSSSSSSRVPRHIDALWRVVDDDPERERIVRRVLERERLQRPLPPAIASATRHAAALRGSAGP